MSTQDEKQAQLLASRNVWQKQ